MWQGRLLPIVPGVFTRVLSYFRDFDDRVTRNNSGVYIGVDYRALYIYTHAERDAPRWKRPRKLPCGKGV